MEAKLFYRIRVKGTLGSRWSTWFDGLEVNTVEDGCTTISGPVADQAALHGVLARIRDLNLTLVSINLAGGVPEQERNEEANLGKETRNHE